MHRPRVHMALAGCLRLGVPGILISSAPVLLRHVPGMSQPGLGQTGATGECHSGVQKPTDRCDRVLPPPKVGWWPITKLGRLPGLGFPQGPQGGCHRESSCGESREGPARGEELFQWRSGEDRMGSCSKDSCLVSGERQAALPYPTYTGFSCALRSANASHTDARCCPLAALCWETFSVILFLPSHRPSLPVPPGRTSTPRGQFGRHGG